MYNNGFYKTGLVILGLTVLATSFSACDPNLPGSEITVPATQSAEPVPPETQSAEPVTPATQSAEPASKSLDEIYAYAGLIELKQADSSFVMDLKNATSDNITGMIQYEYDLGLLHIDAAKKLLQAQMLAMADGYRIKIWDAYRPQSVQTEMNACLPDDKKMFVPALSDYSQHCRGIAVDITLVDENGAELDMPTDYCEFTEAAHADYQGATETQIKNREYLKSIMAKAGFKVLSKEWWHFYLPSYKKYEQLDIKFGDYMQYREADTTVPVSTSP